MSYRYSIVHTSAETITDDRGRMLPKEVTVYINWSNSRKSPQGLNQNSVPRLLTYDPNGSEGAGYYGFPALDKAKDKIKYTLGLEILAALQKIAKHNHSAMIHNLINRKPEG